MPVFDNIHDLGRFQKRYPTAFISVIVTDIVVGHQLCPNRMISIPIRVVYRSALIGLICVGLKCLVLDAIRELLYTTLIGIVGLV